MSQISSVQSTNFYIVFSRSSKLLIWIVLSLLTKLVTSEMNIDSLSLFLMIVCFLDWIYSSRIEIFTIKGVQSNESLHSEWMVWLSNLFKVGQRNMRLIVEFELSWLLVYLIGTWEIWLEILNWNKLALSMSNLLCTEWLGNKESYKLSLMLKSPIIMRTLLILALVSLRYFKAIWEEFK